MIFFFFKYLFLLKNRKSFLIPREDLHPLHSCEQEEARFCIRMYLLMFQEPEFCVAEWVQVDASYMRYNSSGEIQIYK